MHSTDTLTLLTLVLHLCVLEWCKCYVNVALKKPAYQQNPLKPNDSIGDACNAVDGQKSDLSRNGGQCVVSTGKETAMWWVNLTSIHSIWNITIYYMTDNKPWGPTNDYTGFFLGFSVYVSNTTNRQKGTLCFKDNNFTLETIPAVVTVVCPVHGQYVIYYNERLANVIYPVGYPPIAENNVCEIEVYGCPATGCYGSNNSLPCRDDNCKYCHKETGTCQVCQPGYKGQRCELECDTGKYGVNCSKHCGNCYNQSQCNNVNGSCSGGCSPGYTGSLCSDQCDVGKFGIECSKTCGNCHSQSQCHHVDGSCSEGCSAGYKGSFCTDLCDHSFYGIDCSQTCYTKCSSHACNNVNGDCIALQKTKISYSHGTKLIVGILACWCVCMIVRDLKKAFTFITNKVYHSMRKSKNQGPPKDNSADVQRQ